jgi:hypothetical protein
VETLAKWDDFPLDMIQGLGRWNTLHSCLDNLTRSLLVSQKIRTFVEYTIPDVLDESIIVMM